MIIQLVSLIHIIACILLISLVLLQQGKGADMGAAFGGGSNTVFGASGAGNFLTKSTTVIAVIFMTFSVILAMNKKGPVAADNSVFQFEDKKPVTEEPVTQAETATNPTPSSETKSDQTSPEASSAEPAAKTDPQVSTSAETTAEVEPAPTEQPLANSNQTSP